MKKVIFQLKGENRLRICAELRSGS